MKKLLFGLITLFSTLCLAGGDWIGNGGGKEEIEVYFQLHQLSNYSKQIASLYPNPGLQKIHQDILNLEIESKLFLFSEENFPASEDLFKISENQIILSRPQLWTLTNESTWNSKKLIEAFLLALYKNDQIPQVFDFFLSEIEKILTENPLYPVPSDEFSEMGLSIVQSKKSLDLLAFDSKRSVYLTQALQDHLRCPSDSKALKLIDLKNLVWRLDLVPPSMSGKTQKISSQATIHYSCPSQTYASELIIELKIEDQLITGWTFSQWDIHKN